MNAQTSNFGTHKGKAIFLYTLENDNGMIVKITNYGGTITSIIMPDKNGEKNDVVCGFDTLEGYFSEDYKANAPYFGSTIGRYTSQIKDSKFMLENVPYDLVKNCGENNLHGGIDGFDKEIWDSNIFENDEGLSVEMHLLSKDMEEGFPGNVQVRVVFLLTNKNELSIRYQATTDKKTPLSLTNHTYFNLSGFNSSIENHHVKVFASKKLEMDETGAATGVKVALYGEEDDLRSTTLIKEVHDKMNDGFEHYYIFDKYSFDLEKVAEFSCDESGRSMEVTTSEPGMLFYTGKYTSDSLQRESGAQFGKYRGFCCETHRYPNGPNIDGSPETFLKVGEEYTSATIFKFSWDSKN